MVDGSVPMPRGGYEAIAHFWGTEGWVLIHSHIGSMCSHLVLISPDSETSQLHNSDGKGAEISTKDPTGPTEGFIRTHGSRRHCCHRQLLLCRYLVVMLVWCCWREWSEGGKKCRGHIPDDCCQRMIIVAGCAIPQVEKCLQLWQVGNLLLDVECGLCDSWGHSVGKGDRSIHWYPQPPNFA